MSDLDEAKRLLDEGALLAVVKNGEIHTFTERGISALFDVATASDLLFGASVADIIVGKAAALLMIFAKVKRVHGRVMSASADELLTRYGVEHDFCTLTKNIINRRGDGLCPMESAVLKVDSPSDAVMALRRQLESMKS